MKDLKAFERVLKAHANKRRLAIIKFLREKKEAAVGDIASAIQLSFKATSKHLGVLYACDVVEREQRSLQMYYRLPSKPDPVAKYISNSLE